MVKYSTLSSLSLLGVTCQAMALPKAQSSTLALQARGAYGNNTIARPTPADQVTAQTFILTKDNTLNSTNTFSTQDAPSAPLTLNFVNNYAGGNVINAYLVGLDPNGQVAFLKPDGTLYYPPNPAAGNPPTQVDPSSIAIPLSSTGTTTTIALNTYISSGRIYYAAGDLYFAVNNGQAGPALVQPSAANPTDPSAGINWGFTEFTWGADSIYSNLSFVDFLGMVIGQKLTDTSGNTQTVQGVTANAVANVCKALQQQATTDGQPWDQLCVTDSAGTPLRIVSPNGLTSSSSTFSSYYDDYISQVWPSYASSPITVDTAPGTSYTGTYDTGSGNLVFSSGDSFSTPKTSDIFGCNSGPFENSGTDTFKAIGARLCAAFNRSTYLLSGGNNQPDGITSSSSYYTTAPTNYYSSFIHAQEPDGRGYAFAYDDVTPAGGSDASGTLSTGSPSSLTITLGGASAS